MSLTEPLGEDYPAVRPYLGSRGAFCSASFSRGARLRPQVAHSRRVEAGTGGREDRAHLPISPVARLAKTSGDLHPAEGLLHDLAPTLTHEVVLPGGGALVNGIVSLLLGQVGRDAHASSLHDEVLGAVASIGARGQPGPPVRASARAQLESRLCLHVANRCTAVHRRGIPDPLVNLERLVGVS